ncbi:unnamed protein product [Didymodactylos carnosus]|nr:unnamed protein product [Didymodactylos carnosus]CAF3990977.1 unnamed protein product [Didymodactylos carnosus]
MDKSDQQPHTRSTTHIFNTDGLSQLQVDVSDADFNSSSTSSTTTISTIAVQAGDARIVLAILRLITAANVYIKVSQYFDGLEQEIFDINTMSCDA